MYGMAAEAEAPRVAGASLAGCCHQGHPGLFGTVRSVVVEGDDLPDALFDGVYGGLADQLPCLSQTGYPGGYHLEVVGHGFDAGVAARHGFHMLRQLAHTEFVA